MSDISVTDEIRSRLREILPERQKPKLTLRQCAVESGVPTATIWRFVTGKQITSDNLDKLAEWLNKR